MSHKENDKILENLSDKLLELAEINYQSLKLMDNAMDIMHTHCENYKKLNEQLENVNNLIENIFSENKKSFEEIWK